MRLFHDLQLVVPRSDRALPSPSGLPDVPCPDCDGDLVAFPVPDDLREYAPGEAAALCARCLRVHPVDEVAETPPADRASFDAVGDFFPEGRAGIALALALGKLGSLALNRRAIQALCGEAERAGGDVLLALDRVDGAAGVDAHFDVGRRTSQLSDLL